MGDSRFNSDGNKEGEESRVEPISLTKIFEECCPIYMSYGMSYDEFWHGDAYRAKYYRDAFKLKMQHKDEEFWIQGMYIYDAICRVAPILHAFSKSGTKPLPYIDKPYTASITKNMTEEEKEQQVKNERLVAQLHFERWARATAKQFNKENKN